MQKSSQSFLSQSSICEQQFQAKVILIGDSGVGKSSILSYHRTKKFTHITTTIGSDFDIKQYTVGDFNLKMNIWDTAGQCKYRSIVKSLFKGSHAVFYIFDLNNRETFLNLNQWIQDVYEVLPEDTCQIIIGNKSDINDYKVNSSDVKEFQNKYKIQDYIETSAKDGLGIDEMFYKMAEKLKQKYQYKDIPIQTQKLEQKDKISSGCSC